MNINELNDKLSGVTISVVGLSKKKDSELVFYGVKNGKLVEIYLTPRDDGLYIDNMIWWDDP